MRTVFLLLALLPLASCASNPVVKSLYFGVKGATVAHIWGEDTGRVNVEATLDKESTAISLFPTTKTLPAKHSLSEITLYRTRAEEIKERMERFNVSAMVGEDADYRFGVEATGLGKHRSIIFCFENRVEGLPANCPLRITPEGVFVDVNGQWKKVSHEP